MKELKINSPKHGEFIINRKTFSGGYFTDPKEAAKKYNELALKYHGEFAVLNQL